jgi:phage host-nuclease inhibitor protein Gam
MPALERPELVRHLADTTALDTRTAERVLDDVVALLDETVEQFVQRRHGELQRAGKRNEEIFELLADECASWRFRPPSLSSRQLRRIVYG